MICMAIRPQKNEIDKLPNYIKNNLDKYKDWID